MYSINRMQLSKEQLYKKISNIQTKEEFKKNIKELIQEYDELIDEDTAALFIVDKIGQNKENFCKIKELENKMECAVIGKITKINETREFKRKNGTNGRVINLEISDETGSCLLVLWDKDVELVENKTLELNSNVKVINGYVKDGYNGLELNLGRWGLIKKIDEEQVPEVKKTQEDKISGEITDIKPTKPFFRDNGEFGFVTKIQLQTSNRVKQITLWDEKVKEMQQYKIGDKLEISNISLRENNGNTEFHLNGKSKILKI